MDYSNPPYPQMSGTGVPGMPGQQPAPGMPGQPTPPEGGGKRSRKKGGDVDKAPTKKVINRQFVIATLFAVVAAGGIYVYSQGTAPTEKFVVVSNAAIATNTPIDSNLLKAVAIDEALIQPGAVTASSPEAAVAEALDELEDARSQFPITANQQIIPEQFGAVVNLDTPLKDDERLVSFRASVASTVAGSIKPGDLVDMYATSGDVTGVIAYNVPVVSVTVSEERYNAVADAQSGNKDVRASDVLPGDPVPGTYVIRVKADQVGKVIAADSGGKIYLTYRTADAKDSLVEPTTALQAICEGAIGNPVCP